MSLMSPLISCQFMQLVVDGIKEDNKVIFFCRSVEKQERPFALGMQFVLLRTLGESQMLYLLDHTASLCHEIHQPCLSLQQSFSYSTTLCS